MKGVTRFMRWEIGLLVLAGILFIAMSLLSSDFFSAFTLQSLVLNATVIGFLALGETAVIMTADIDISVASSAALSGVVIGVLWSHGVNIWVASALGLVVGAVLGLINGLAVVLMDLPALAITLGTMGAYTGIAFLILGGSAISNFPTPFVNLGSGLFLGTPVPTAGLVLLLVAALLAFLIHRTNFGRTLIAIGANRQASRYSGLAVVRTRIGAFILSGFMAAVAAIFYLAYFNSIDAGSATSDLLPAITVVLLGGVSAYGGTGTVAGVVVALGVVGILESGLGVLGVSGEEEAIAVGGVLILTVATSALGRWLRARAASRPEPSSAATPPQADQQFT